MGNPCKCECNEHVHAYCIYTEVKDCHRHVMKGVTCPAPDTPNHKHELDGNTSCNDGHSHEYCGKTDKPIYMCRGHVHNFEGKTACADDHKHRYQGTTDPERTSFFR